MKTAVKVPGGTCGVADAGEAGGAGPPMEQVMRNVAGVEWAATKREKEEADAADATVQAIITDLQQVKADVRAAASGQFTFTKAQALKLVRAVLWHIKDDKS